MYQNGLGVDRDYKNTLEWYIESAEQRNKTAQYYLGCLYENGFGVGKDYEKAVEWYIKSAEQRNKTAQYSLGCLYVNGFGVGKDYKKDAIRKRREYENRGVNALNDGYSPEELSRVSRFFFEANIARHLRNCLDFLLGYAILGRGETKRLMQLPDLFSVEFADEGPTKCVALVITLKRGKTNQHGRLEYGAAIRSRNMRPAPLALWRFTSFFHRWHFEEESMS